MKKTRTIMIDGIKIQTSLTGVEIAGLVQRNEELKQLVKKQQKKISKVTTLIKKYGKYDGEKCTRGFQMYSADFNKILDILKNTNQVLPKSNASFVKQIKKLNKENYFDDLFEKVESDEQMITDNEKFIEIQAILSLSDISPNDCIKINNLIIELSKENEELKKQVEEYQKELEKADSITQSCIFNGKEGSEISYRKCLNMLDKKEAQQKEFINYLKDESKEIYRDGGLRQNIYKEILQKYKEIIGENDENN